jgi:hypothetical protein
MLDSAADRLPVQASLTLSPALPNLRSLNQYLGGMVFFRESEDAPFTRGRLTLEPRKTGELAGVAEGVLGSLQGAGVMQSAPKSRVGTPPHMSYSITPMVGDDPSVLISDLGDFGKLEICVYDNSQERDEKMVKEIEGLASRLGLNPIGFTTKDGRYWVELPGAPAGARFYVEFHSHFVRIGYGGEDARFNTLSDRLINQWGPNNVELSAGDVGVSSGLRLSELEYGRNFTIAQDVSDPLSPSSVHLRAGDVVCLRMLDADDKAYDSSTPLTELLVNDTTRFELSAEELSRMIVKTRL